ncbi:hypothetical protein HK096_008769 [Nowakowskiella sp. JEL0078]|nr:hypothetical protein HK096_008769 [Nowakowskiella sp. JEL0078]
MSSILNKALRAPDENRNESRTTTLEDAEYSESFTILLGTQVQTMYNLRLVVLTHGMEDVFRSFAPAPIQPKRTNTPMVVDAAQEIAYRAQTASALYTNDLCGAVVLLTPGDFAKYGREKTANRVLFERCKKSTEFHFEDLETQIKKIKSRVPKDENGNPIVYEGDFFITKHSNLPLIHVIFHLVVEEDSLKSELTNRSSLMNGYRTILKTAHMYSVNSIAVPLPLISETPEIISKSSNKTSVSMAENSFYRRVDVVLKGTKGMLMELARVSKHAGDSSGVEKYTKTIHFVVPENFLGNWGVIVGSEKVASVFGVIKEKVSEVFRTS